MRDFLTAAGRVQKRNKQVLPTLACMSTSQQYPWWSGEATKKLISWISTRKVQTAINIMELDNYWSTGNHPLSSNYQIIVIRYDVELIVRLIQYLGACNSYCLVTTSTDLLQLVPFCYDSYRLCSSLSHDLAITWPQNVMQDAWV